MYRPGIVSSYSNVCNAFIHSFIALVADNEGDFGPVNGRGGYTGVGSRKLAANCQVLRGLHEG